MTHFIDIDPEIARALFHVEEEQMSNGSTNITVAMEPVLREWLEDLHCLIQEYDYDWDLGQRHSNGYAMQLKIYDTAIAAEFKLTFL